MCLLWIACGKPRPANLTDRGPTAVSALCQTLALSGAGEGGFDSGEMLRLSLDLAAATDPDTDVGFEQLKDAAAAIVHLLEADDQGFQTWPVRACCLPFALCTMSSEGV